MKRVQKQDGSKWHCSSGGHDSSTSSGNMPAGLKDLGAVLGRQQAPEGHAALGIALGQGCDGRSAGAIQCRQESALSNHCQACVLVVQLCQESPNLVVSLSAGDADGTLQAACIS